MEWRDLLEPGTSFLLRVSGEYEQETEDIRVRVLSIEPLEAAAARTGGTLRIFVDDMEPVPHVAKRLEGDGEGIVRFVCLLRKTSREVEIELPGRYRVTAAVAGAVKAVPGVVHIENAPR